MRWIIIPVRIWVRKAHPKKRIVLCLRVSPRGLTPITPSGRVCNNRAPKRSSVREYSTTRVPNLSQSSISSPKLTRTKPCDLSPFTYPTGFLVPCLLVFVFNWLKSTQLHDGTPRGRGIELTAIDSIAADLAKTGYAASRAKREELTREHEQSLISQLVQLEQELLRIKELSSLSTTAKSRCHLAWGRSLKNVFPWSQVS